MIKHFFLCLQKFNSTNILFVENKSITRAKMLLYKFTTTTFYEIIARAIERNKV